MCYSVYFSTSSSEDFSLLGSDPYYVLRMPDRADLVKYASDPNYAPSEAQILESEILDLLAHDHRWYLGSKYGGCSCHFRFAFELNDDVKDEDLLGLFRPPEDWSPEDQDNIESTHHFYDLMKRLRAEGSQVDVLCHWSDPDVEDIETMTIDLDKVPRDHFRFFESFRFILA